ncbi:MAG: metalloregulator ArsR/SmtB family transcription factor [bacterium]
MDSEIKAKYQARAKIIKSMAHPTRLFIVDILAQKELSVGDLTDMIGADVSTVSKHLSILKNAAIVRDEKRGTQVFYSLSVPCVLNFFSCVESVIKSSVEEQIKIAR